MAAIVIALCRAIFTNIYLFLLIIPRACILILQSHAPCTSSNKQHGHMQDGIKATFLQVFVCFLVCNWDKCGESRVQIYIFPALRRRTNDV